jgi:hypothetical protein
MKDLDHPCRTTCSGWAQGFERGQSASIDKIDRLRKERDELDRELSTEVEGRMKDVARRNSALVRVMKLESALHAIHACEGTRHDMAVIAEEALAGEGGEE